MLNLKIPLFSIGNIEVYTKRKQASKAMSRLGIDVDVNQIDGCFAYEAYPTSGVFVMCIFDGKVGTVAHESFHAAIRVLHAAGVPVVPDSPNEAHAYLMEYLVNEISEYMGAKCN